MATVAITQADLTRCLKRTLNLLGLNDPNYPYGVEIRPASPFSRQAVIDALLQSDAEIRIDIADTLDHPFRTLFFETAPTEIDTSGASIPPAVTSTNRVEILAFDEDDRIWATGRLARNFDHLRNVKEFPAVFGTGSLLYWIETGRIYFIGAKARIFQTLVTIDRTTAITGQTFTGKLQSPEIYENGIIANAIPVLYMNGQDSNQRQFYLQQAAMFRAKLRQNEHSLPEPQRFERLGD